MKTQIITKIVFKVRGTSKKYHTKKEKTKYWECPKKARLMPALKTHDQTAYFYYRRHRKTSHEIGENRSLYSKSVMAIYKAIGELVSEHEGGVFLEDYGLFCGMIIPWNNKGINFKSRVDPLFHTEGYSYCLQLFTDVTKNSCIKRMVMDRAFDYRVSSKLSKAIYDDFRPKLYFTPLKHIHGNTRRKKQ